METCDYEILEKIMKKWRLTVREFKKIENIGNLKNRKQKD